MTSTTPSHPIQPPFDIQLRRLVDAHILHENTAQAAQKCLETLQKIATNILNNRTNTKYFSLKDSNQHLQNTILKQKGGQDALVLMGFRKRVKEFEAQWVFEDGLEKLAVAVDVFKEYGEKVRERCEREMRKRDMAALEQKMRREKVLMDIEEDRQERKRRASLKGH
ncbi:uncharacterized protein SPPG_06753 [Spizellomyces punctatus DAOM BR117]|uniref:PUB domain-containing protein n=1 Tax=Spizellomyces punctatus (strain DAOM BR117) TaxID=645134 RepID=A0A0L0H979_SPIPD|nr:uncharacterized protein SPPG_06753 [Spizellomyces punctatus DAOM BR117]KNC97752.1 hypothetical protein SPPG_06753 [Spizellomyces punctatus DAOM BR117]|eukprot:XP_016605792.1 hypothetical protein SPPG_06753 [Spizellomyces punctatus DAOM BR117]